MNNLRRTLIFIAALALLFSAVTPALAGPAQVSIPHNLRFEHITIEDGLSQNAVLTTLQDSHGYLWIGTQDGLNRYDGISFTTYRNESGNLESISHSSVLSLAEDKNGYLWIGTWGGGLNKFDPTTGIFTAFKHDPQNIKSLSDDTVTDLLVTRDGALWIGTLKGLDRMSTDGSFDHYQNNPGNDYSLSADNVSSLLQAPDGTIWVGTGFMTDGGGLNRMNTDGTFTRYQNDPANPASLASNNIGSMLIDKNGTLWIGTGGYSIVGAGLDKLNADGTFSHYRNDPLDQNSVAADNVMSIYQDVNGILWLGLWGGGVDLFDPSAKDVHFSHARNNPYDASSLSTDIVWDINGDRSGVIWIGTLNGGLNKFTPLTAQFALYQHDPSDPESLGFNVVGGFYEDHAGGLWVNTWGGGLESFDRKTGKFQHFRNDPNNPKSLIGDNVMVVFQDNMETFWVGTMNGLTKFDRNANTFTPVLHDPNNPNSLINDSPTQILNAGPKKIWIATLGGLDLYDYATDTYTHYLNDPRDPKSLSNNSIVSMFKDSNGTLWLGTWGFGLNRMNPDGTFTHFSHNPLDPKSISEDSIWVIQQDSKGFLWIGTQIGLNRMNPDGTFTAYHMKDGLPNETIMGILEDNSGKLWISTGNGLARFDPEKQIFKTFDAHDGLQSNEFDSSAFFKDHDGKLYFGGIRGFNVFDPKNISENNVPPLVAVSRFLIFNQPMQVDLSGKTRLEVPYWQNFFAFEFAALDFHAPSKNKYAYKLEGFDEDWVDAGSRRYASYTNLSGGNYLFRVKAANNDGVWNDQGVSIPITVTPPFWGTWWFQGGFALLVIGMLAVGYTVRVRGIQAQKKALETEVAQRTEELRLAQEELAKRAEEELSVSEARFRAVFDSSAVGIGIMGLDRKILEANPAMCKMLDRSAEELIGETPQLATFSDDYPQSTQDFQDLLSGKLDHYWSERRYIRRNGEVFWASVTMSIVRDLNGTPRYLVGMLIDVDEQKKMQETIRTSEARFRAMFDNTSVGISLMAVDRKVVQVNQAAERITGFSADELKNMNISDLAYVGDRQVGLAEFKELVDGSLNGFQTEKRYIRKDGSMFWGRVTYTSVRDSDCCPQYVIGMIEDITEQRQSREKLAAQEKEYRAKLEKRVEERTHELAEANLRLMEEIEQRQRAEQALATKAAEEAVIAERTRLARDLHDAVTQTLFSASLIAEVLPDLWNMDEAEALKSTEELRQLTRGALAEMRTLLLELRPAALTQARFGDLLKQLSEALIGRARLPIRLSVEGERSLPPEVQVALYRIAQESLNNVFKYARATQVDVNLILSPAGVHLEIIDNGIGFDMSLLKPTSLGMRIMRERAEAIHADFEVTSKPGEGTHVSVTWNAG